MIAMEANISRPRRTSVRPALEIRFQFVEGTEETFVQSDPEIAQKILMGISPPLLFNHYRIVVADDYSKSVFVCSQLNRVDFVYEAHGLSHIPVDHADLVELTEADFHKYVRLDDPDHLQKRWQPRQVGDLLVSFLHLRMRGGTHVYLM